MTHDLEQMLKEIALRQPGAGLDGKVAVALDSGDAETVTAERSGAVWGWLAKAAVFGVAMLIGAAMWTVVNDLGRLSDQVGGTRTALPGGGGTDGFEPIQISNVYSNLMPEGVVQVGDAPPIQRFRYERVDQLKLIDAERNIRIEVLRPHQDVLYVPMRDH